MTTNGARYHLKLSGGPSRGRQWSWFVENPEGGGSGMNAGAGVSRTSAHRVAVSRHTGLPVGTRYDLSVNGKYLGTLTRGEESWALKGEHRDD
jgi:hypothetical protein